MFEARIKRLLLLLVVLFVCLAMFLVQRQHRALVSRKPPPSAVISPELFAQFTAIENQEQRMDETVWATERRAEQRGALFDALWDALNRATNKFDLLASFPIGELVVSKYNAPTNLVHGIQLWDPAPAKLTWLQDEWQRFLDDKHRQGWQLGHVEFRHRSFMLVTNGQPEQSRFSFRADLQNEQFRQAATLEGELQVEWVSQTPDSQPVIKRLDASRISVRARTGEAPFQPIFTQAIEPPGNWIFIDPLILYDLDRDGLSEIILAGKNLVYHRQRDGNYEARPLCQYDPGKLLSALIADFDGDGLADLLCAKAEGLLLFKGSPQGTFDQAPRLVWPANPPLKYAQVLTCGDIDRDGDLDVFLAQYKTPYIKGQMPSPYYDANDGEPSHLLLNDGQGNFSEATESCGLGQKRWRRSYSGSFVRMDRDDALDLLVVSDFAGLDFYHNEGHGHFSEVTRERFPDWMAFGMAHTFADFNADGRLDLLMVGMESPTVERLDRLGLYRPGVNEDRTSRTRLTYGNRLFLAGGDHKFEQTSLNDSVSHSGWSWGCCAADFDNDGFPDLYIANGHETRQTVRDYEPEYWLHDIYVGASTNNRAAELYFQSKFTRTRGRGESYGGNEINRLYLNLEAKSFLEAGSLFGVGLEQDCRNVVADDLDGDGRVDLLVSTFEVWPAPKQTLRVYRNSFSKVGRWIGFRFEEQGRGKSPVGTMVTIRYGEHAATRQIVTGDSYRCQSANTLHFGLGNADQIEDAEVLWPNGLTTHLTKPALNQYHIVRQP